MEKEILLTELKKELGEPAANGYLGDTGVTMRTLDRYADAILPTITDDMVSESFFKNQADVIKAIGGQMRFEQAEFAKNYKPKGAGSQVPPTTPPTGDPGVADLLKRLETLEKERKTEQKNTAVREMRSDVFKKSGDLKVSNKNLWEDSVRMVEYKEGMDVDSMTAKAKEIYESKLKAYCGDGAVPYNGGSQSAPPSTDRKYLDDFFAKKALEGKFPQKNQ